MCGSSSSINVVGTSETFRYNGQTEIHYMTSLYKCRKHCTNSKTIKERRVNYFVRQTRYRYVNQGPTLIFQRAVDFVLVYYQAFLSNTRLVYVLEIVFEYRHSRIDVNFV